MPDELPKENRWTDPEHLLNFFSSNFNQVNNSYIGDASIEDELAKWPEFNEAWGKAKRTYGDRINQVAPDTVAKKCWTVEYPPFYKTVNRELRAWHESGSVQKPFPYNNFVKILERQCGKLESWMTLYRGIDHKDLPLIHEGKYLTCPCMYSCSTNKETAEDYAGTKGTLMIIETNYAISIREESMYENEDEHLIPSGMHFKVLDHQKMVGKFDIIHIKLAEVKIVSMIRNDLALDISYYFIKLQKFDSDNVMQRWFIQGRYIRSSFNGDVLDIDYRTVNHRKDPKGANVVNWRLHCKPNQEWFYTKEQLIVSGIEGYVMQVKVKDSEMIEADSCIDVNTITKNDNQLFQIEFINS